VIGLRALCLICLPHRSRTSTAELAEIAEQTFAFFCALGVLRG
jgi:hypothetical protein